VGAHRIYIQAQLLPRCQIWGPYWVMSAIRSQCNISPLRPLCKLLISLNNCHKYSAELCLPFGKGSVWSVIPLGLAGHEGDSAHPGCPGEREVGSEFADVTLVYHGPCPYPPRKRGPNSPKCIIGGAGSRYQLENPQLAGSAKPGRIDRGRPPAGVRRQGTSRRVTL